MSGPWLPYACRGCYNTVRVRGYAGAGSPEVECGDCGGSMRYVGGGE